MIMIEVAFFIHIIVEGFSDCYWPSSIHLNRILKLVLLDYSTLLTWKS